MPGAVRTLSTPEIPWIQESRGFQGISGAGKVRTALGMLPYCYVTRPRSSEMKK